MKMEKYMEEFHEWNIKRIKENLKTLRDMERNAKAIEQWFKEISIPALHKRK